MQILLASTNPNKIEGTKRAFAEFPEVFGPADKLTVEAQKFPSNISDQPIGYEQTMLGAYNRALNARKSDKNNVYDFYVGIESGIVFLNNHPHLTTYGCVIASSGGYYFGSSMLHPLPETVIETLAKGEELAVFAEQITGTHDVRSKGGIAGYLFKNKYTRHDVNYLAVKGALAGFIRAEKYEIKVDKSTLPKIFYISTSIANGVIKNIPIKIAEWIEEAGGIVNDKHVIYAGHDEYLRQKYMTKFAKKYYDLDFSVLNQAQINEFIYKVDTLLVDQATHIVALLDKPSSGVAMEIEHALSREARGLPRAQILGLVHKDNYAGVSGMLKGAAEVYKNFEIRVYESLGDIERLVKNFL